MSTAVKTSALARPQRDSRASHGPGPIDRFLDAVWMERGLAPNTLAAYRADLTALDRWLENHETELTSAKRGDLLEFMAARAQAGARPRSTARQLSSFRRFYRYLVREGSLREDPTAQIAMPKVGRSLPRSLTEEEVEALLAAPTVSDP
ncbi:MAG TPA: site-specific integrase, partial [Steroidobacteraceae bacterium]|nr:site-specific integrase [Steroidobacteraceae bacterium]